MKDGICEAAAGDGQVERKLIDIHRGSWPGVCVNNCEDIIIR